MVDRRARLVFEQVDAQGRRRFIQLVAPHSSAGARPALAATKDHILGVWVSHGSLMGAWLGTRPLVPFVVTRGAIDHPFVSGGAHHFAVLFQRLHTARSDIYQAWVPLQRGQSVRMQRLVRSQDVALYPRGAIDGSGALDLIYLERCCEETAWRIIFRRFDLPWPTTSETARARYSVLRSPEWTRRYPLRNCAAAVGSGYEISI